MSITINHCFSAIYRHCFAVSRVLSRAASHLITSSVFIYDEAGNRTTVFLKKIQNLYPESASGYPAC